MNMHGVAVAKGADENKAPPLATLAKWGGLNPGTKVQKVALYPRIEKPPPPTQ